jgi:Ring finger domain
MLCLAMSYTRAAACQCVTQSIKSVLDINVQVGATSSARHPDVVTEKELEAHTCAFFYLGGFMGGALHADTPLHADAAQALTSARDRDKECTSGHCGGRYARQTACAICQADLELGDRLRRLPCTHSFHVECLNPWVTVHNNCPLCKAEVV